MNYMGPGTHVVDRITNGVLPINYVDSIARQHDVDYIRYPGVLGGAYSDVKAIINSYVSPTPEAMVMRLGLGARLAGSMLTGGYGFNYNQPITGLDDVTSMKVGEELNSIINTEVKK